MAVDRKRSRNQTGRELVKSLQKTEANQRQASLHGERSREQDREKSTVRSLTWSTRDNKKTPTRTERTWQRPKRQKDKRD
eukprot:755704-Hanusia_phi.AAC.2